MPRRITNTRNRRAYRIRAHRGGVFHSGLHRSRLNRYRRIAQFKTHSFMRNTRPITYSLENTSNWVPNTLTFQLSDVINVSDFENLFDQFKISKVVLTLRWTPRASTYTSTNTIAATGVYNPVLYYYTDHDDDDPVATQQDMLEVQKHKSVRIMPSRPINITVKPAVQAMAYQTALSTSYGPKWGMRLNMDDNTTPWYGLKMGVSKLGVDLGTIVMDVKYYFTCYGVQ